MSPTWRPTVRSQDQKWPGCVAVMQVWLCVSALRSCNPELFDWFPVLPFVLGVYSVIVRWTHNEDDQVVILEFTILRQRVALGFPGMRHFYLDSGIQIK